MFPSIQLSPQFDRYITVPKTAAGVRHYNGSTCEHGQSLVHAWRAEDATGKSRIMIGRINRHGKISKAVTLMEHDAFDAEDPRLFVVNDQLFLMWSRVRDTWHDCGRWQVTMMVSHVDAFALKLTDTIVADLPLPLQPVEKNWTPLPDGGWLYDIPSGISVTAAGKIRVNEHWKFPWGSFSGSTPALAWPGHETWIAFYHGFMTDAGRVKRYFFGAYEIDPQTYEILRISRVPLVFASDDDETIPCPRDAIYNPAVVFPCGLVRDGDAWLVSGGVHDSRDAWWRFADKDLQLVARSLALVPAPLTAQAGEVAPDGWCHVRVISKEPVGENGSIFKRGQIFLTTKGRREALGAYVETVTL